MNALLLANGPIRDYAFARRIGTEDHYIVACDGGLAHAHALGWCPDLIIGDMDSVPSALLAAYIEKGIHPQQYPQNKDDTDLSLGMAQVLAQNPSSITVLGALGGRFDHTLGNVHVLAMALARGIPACLLDEHTCVRLMERRCRLNRESYDTVTLIPFSTTVTGIVTQGLAFPLRGETLCLGTTRGVSNRFTADEAEISATDGILAVILYKEA